MDFYHHAQRARKITLAVPSRALDSNEEHRKIVNALKEHNADLAEQLTNEHMANTIRNMEDRGVY